MTRDLLAPPKISPRRYTVLVVLLTASILVLAAVLSWGESRTTFSWGVRVLACAAVAATQILAYRKLVARSRGCAPERMPLIHAMAVLLTYAGCFGVAYLAGSDTFVGRAILQNWWQGLAMFGFMLGSGGIARRVGDSLHCPACEYQFAFANPDDAPIRCPECGFAWLGMLRRGRRVASARLIAVGAAIVFLSVVVAQPIFYMRWLAPRLPTPLLYASLYVEPKTWFSAWDELAARPLDAPSVRAMARRVLSLRASNQYDNAPIRWFEAMAAAGKIPAAELDRYYRESIVAELLIPTRVRSGASFAAKLRVRRVAPTASQQIGVFFGGYRIADSGPVGRQDQTVWAFRLRPDVFSPHRDELGSDLTAGPRGTARVRAEFWVVYLPSFNEALRWNPDGTPARPPQALWFERITLERDIIVE